MITDEMVGAAMDAYDASSFENVADAMRAALEVYERAAWQPIETAPKDSATDIWIARGKRIAIASWFSKWDYCRGGPYTDCWVQPGGVVFNPPPTHWRPLPPPPADGGETLVDTHWQDV